MATWDYFVRALNDTCCRLGLGVKCDYTMFEGYSGKTMPESARRARLYMINHNNRGSDTPRRNILCV